MRRVLFIVMASLAACAGGTGRSGLSALPDPGESRWVPGRGEEDVSGLRRRLLEPALDSLPLTPIARTHPQVGRLHGSGSLSIGTTNHGILVGCRTLPLEGPHHRVLKVQSQRGTNCGTDELVAALLRASREVAAASPGAILTVGNVGRVGGGRIVWSVSHRTGRDADLGLYVRGPDGRQFVPSNLVSLDASGRGVADGVPVRFDTARNWALVKALLNSREVSVQWLFLSNPLRRSLLDWAKAQKEPKELVRRAEAALVQPGRSSPHDDHLHLRVYCSADDVLEGCRDVGTNRPWFKSRSGEVSRRVRELLGLVESPEARVRADAVTVLGRLGRGEARDAVARALRDRDASVRLAAARALPSLGGRGLEALVASAVAGLPDDGAVAAMLSALEDELRPASRAAVLGRLLSVDRAFTADLGVFQARWTVASWSAQAIVRLDAVLATRTLVAALPEPGVDLAAVDGALRLVTQASPAPADAPAEERKVAWKGWWARHRGEKPLQWKLEALVLAGLLDRPVVPGLAQVPDLLAAARRQPDLARTVVAVVAAAVGRRFGRLPLDGIEPFADLAARASSAEAVIQPLPAVEPVAGGGD